METIKIADEALRMGAEEGMDGFLQVFIDKYLEVTGGEINASTMPLLNGHQHKHPNGWKRPERPSSRLLHTIRTTK